MPCTTSKHLFHLLQCLVLRSVLSVFINLRSAECVCSYYGLRVCSQTNKLNFMSQLFCPTSILDISQFAKMLWFWACVTKFWLWSWVCFFSAVTSAFQFFTRKLCLQFSGLRMRNFTWNRFPIKNLLIDSLLTPIVESTYFLIEMN